MSQEHGESAVLSMNGPYVVTVLGEELEIIITSSNLERGFRLDDSLYFPRTVSGWSGFYDWLRDRSGKVVGVRYWLFDEAFGIAQGRIPDYVYVEPERGLVEIYFGTRPEIDQGQSDDQAFGGNRVFSSDTTLAVSFDLGTLSTASRASIESTGADSRLVPI